MNDFLTQCCKDKVIKHTIYDYYYCQFCGELTNENGVEKDPMQYGKTWRVAGETKRIVDLEDSHLVNILKWIDKQEEGIGYDFDGDPEPIYGKEEIRESYNYRFIERQCILRGLIKPDKE